MFDPNEDGGPYEEDIIHINHVKVHDGKIYVSGTKFNSLIEIDPKLNKITNTIKCHFGTHNAQFYKGNLLFNDTKEDRALLTSTKGKVLKRFDIKVINPIIPKERVQIEKRKPIAKRVKNQSVSVCSFVINHHGVHRSTFLFWSYPLFDRSLKLARSVSRQLLNAEYLSAYVTSKFNSELNKTPVKMPLTLNTWNFASG